MANIMIIDGHTKFTESLSGALFDAGHMIFWSVETDDVIEKVRTFMPDIVLFDIFLDGFERCDVLGRIKLEYPRLPVIIVTAYETHVRDSRFVQADGYIIKDIHTDKLVKKIEQMITDQALNQNPPGEGKGGLHGHSNFRQRRKNPRPLLSNH
jgi:DNA-binding NtrC family response regulator